MMGTEISPVAGQRKPSIIQSYAADLEQAIPRTGVSVTTFIRLADSAIRFGGADLKKAADENPLSLMTTLIRCAALGHVPGPQSKDFYLVSFNNFDKELNRKVPTVSGIEGYQGLIARFMKATPGLSVRTQLIREQDEFEFDPNSMDRPRHVFDPLASDSRGALTGAYAYGVLPSEKTSQVVVMGRDEIMKHKAAARSRTFWEGPWEPSMWVKTVVKGLEAWLPTSAEYRDEALRIRSVAVTTAERWGVDPAALESGPDDPAPVEAELEEA